MVAATASGGGVEELVAADGVGVVVIGEDEEVGDRQGDDGFEQPVAFAAFELAGVGFGGVVDDSFGEGFDGQDLHLDDDDGVVVEDGFDIEDALLEAVEVGVLVGIEDFEVGDALFAVVDDRIEKVTQDRFTAIGAEDAFEAEVGARIDEAHDVRGKWLSEFWHRTLTH